MEGTASSSSSGVQAAPASAGVPPGGSATNLLEQLPPTVRHAVLQEIERRVASQVEAEVSQQRRLLDLAQEGGRVGVFEIDMRSGISTGSAMWARLLGRPEGTALVDRDLWISMVHPDDRKHVLQAVARAASLACDTSLDYRVILPNGDVRWLHSRNLIETDEHGRARRAYGTLQDISERKALEAQILHNANHDLLTGLPNRRMFMAELARAFDSDEHGDQEIAVALFDLDHLKPANDRHGHEAGDALLQAAATRLSSTVDRVGMAARLGGDEFAVILRGQGARGLRTTAERSLNALRQPVRWGSSLLQCGASAGGAVGSIAAGSTPEQLMRAADKALYTAKETDRGSYRQAG